MNVLLIVETQLSELDECRKSVVESGQAWVPVCVLCFSYVMMTNKLLKIKALPLVRGTRQKIMGGSSRVGRVRDSALDLLSKNERVTHESRGDGIIEKVQLSSAKPYTVRFTDSGEVHSYSEVSAKKLKRQSRPGDQAQV